MHTANWLDVKICVVRGAPEGLLWARQHTASWPAIRGGAWVRRLGVLLAALLLALVSAPPAAAIEPPTIDPAAVPPDETGPDQPTEQRRVCSAPTAFPNANLRTSPGQTTTCG